MNTPHEHRELHSTQQALYAARPWAVVPISSVARDPAAMAWVSLGMLLLALWQDI